MVKNLTLVSLLCLCCVSFASIGKEVNGHWVFTSKKAYGKYITMESESDQLFHNGEWEKSISVLNKIKKKYPKVYETYAKISYLRWSQSVAQKDFVNQQKYLSLALKEGAEYRKIMPHDPDRANIEGIVYSCEKNWKKQAEIMSEVLKKKNRGKPSLQAYALVCVAYERLGDKKNSIYWLEKAVKDYPTYEVGKNKLNALK